MPTSQDIADQQRLLAQHRQNVQTLLEQITSQGGAIHASLNLRNTLADAQKDIGRCKAILRGWGVRVDDHPNDADVVPAAMRRRSKPSWRWSPRRSAGRWRAPGCTPLLRSAGWPGA